MAMTLTGYTIAMSGPQSGRFHAHLLGLGALLSEPSRPALLRLVVQRHVHAVAFASAPMLAALLSLSNRTGLQAQVLTAFASDVIAAGDAEAVATLSQRGLPVLIGRPVPANGQAGIASDVAAQPPLRLARPLLEHALAAALWAQRREFTAGRLRFVLQGNALLVDGRAIALDPPLATVLRALADSRGAPVPRSTLARLSVRRVEQTVSQLRTALGERSWLIATVSRRGYRLVVEGAATS
ncbi:uroporphyrinogen-III synthase [Catelliglobosispora koreensis]|uniref:hypothetical protein n=1 Tax=Catelliglobosispora koreensis TaxID=129052 RepID=UPI0012FC8652|nr:hypothetical protein [Catelliglobosispora koreensis]